MARHGRHHLLVMGLLVALGPAPLVRAHIVPIPPSVCEFEPLGLRVPATGVAGNVQAAGPTDAMRILYDPSASQVQICRMPADQSPGCLPGDPRAFTLGSAAGAVTFPTIFGGRMLSSGDVTITDLPLSVSLGATAVTTRLTLTTGLVSVNGAVAEGTPLQGLGSFTLVGSLDGGTLPAPLAGQSVLVTLSCQPRPVPDKDQFVSPPVMGSIGGQLTSTQARLRATVSVSTSSPPDLSGPLLLAVNLDGQMVASGVFSAGVQGRRLLTGTSDDGDADITIRRASAGRLIVSARLRKVTLPPQSPHTPVLLDVTLDGGSFISRGEQLFKTSGSGRRVSRG